jgi:type IV pilus assembly protein PilQ
MSVRKHVKQVAALAGLGVLWAVAGQGDNLKLKNVEVVGTGDGARVVLDVDGGVTHRAFTLSNPDRIVVDLVGAVNAVKGPAQSFESGPVSRLRVSQFQSNPSPVTRVVADLRSKTGYQVEEQDEDVVLVVGSGVEVGSTQTAAPVVDAGAPAASDPAAFTSVATESTSPFTTPAEETQAAAAAAAAPVADATPSVADVAASAGVTQSSVTETVTGQATTPATETAPVVAEQAPAVGAPVTAETAPTVAAVAAPVVQSVADEMHAVVGGSFEDTAPDAPPGGIELKPTGSDKRINLDVQGADIHTVLRTLADYSGKNIIASKDVEGEVTARLYDTPWQDALTSVLKAHGYGYIEENGIIRVGVMQKIRNEELEEAAADRKREDLQPIETQVVRLQFADAEELKPALSDMMSSRGKLQVDTRTNALIVSDIPAYVAKVAAMAGDLDSRTPQVEIVSKLIDVSADDSKNLGINWSANNIQPNGSPVNISAGVSAPTTGAVGNLRIGTVQSWGQLTATLDALAKNKKANVVSNPNITTVNNREAKILVGAKIPLIVADQAGNAITQLTKIGIQMAATPHVNSDKTITMDLHTEVSELSSQATVQGGVIIQTSEADTRVLVENGDTAIIGGLVRNIHSSTKTGIPVLQSMPLIGWFFRNTSTEDDKRELIIFVTPRLIEPGEKLRSSNPSQG